MNEKDCFPVVTVTFKDKTTLNRCVIFPEEPFKAGMESLKDEESINEKFKKLPWYSKWDGLVYFQNKYINGHFHVENIESYDVYFITKEEF